ncbi:MAG: hypothetical protein LBB85_04300 [Dysgonamonadaceae bacterium]|jgi:hypothetical protein|nr:hypothetical protein [Dysgonamonadaceae bacterium]
MIHQYEIGGNAVSVDASEAIAAIPENRTLLVEKLTDDEAIHPEVVTGLSSIEQVFAHYKPQTEVEFQNGEGQPVKESFYFQSVGDFSVKNLTEQSRFLKHISTEKTFYESLSRQLRTNKILQRVLENPASRQAFIASLEALETELGSAE